MRPAVQIVLRNGASDEGATESNRLSRKGFLSHGLSEEESDLRVDFSPETNSVTLPTRPSSFARAQHSPSRSLRVRPACRRSSRSVAYCMQWGTWRRRGDRLRQFQDERRADP